MINLWAYYFRVFSVLVCCAVLDIWENMTNVFIELEETKKTLSSIRGGLDIKLIEWIDSFVII